MNSRLVCALLAISASLHAADKHAFTAKGLYSEACNCKIPCSCNMTGLMSGCEGVGAIQLTSGSYDGQDLSGMKAAYAGQPGKWVRLYVEAATPEQAKAARAFLTALYKEWGDVEAVRDAKVDISGEAGNYTVTVDEGKIMKFKTAAVLGADQKTPISHGNINDPLNDTFLQAKNESCTYKDGAHEINLASGRNAYFNDKMDKTGDI